MVGHEQISAYYPMISVNRSLEKDSYLRVVKRSEMLTHLQTFLDPGGDSLRLEKKVHPAHCRLVVFNCISQQIHLYILRMAAT